MIDVDKYKELIEREIVERPISVRDLAKEIKISYQTIYAILHRRYDEMKTTTRLKLDNHFGIASEREPTHEELQAQIQELEARVRIKPGLLNDIHIDPYEEDRLKKTHLAENGNVRFFARLSGVDAGEPKDARAWFEKLRPQTQKNLIKLWWLFDQILVREGLSAGEGTL